MKIYDNTFKNVLDKEVFENYHVILITIKICSASYIICWC